MSERGQFRGGRGGGRGHSGGRGGARGGAQSGAGADRPKKENILDLAKYMDKDITVKFNGGREVTGKLKGYDQLMNLVLDDVQEKLRDEEGNETTRALGLLVARGTLIVLISPLDGSRPIENPFGAEAESVIRAPILDDLPKDQPNDAGIPWNNSKPFWC